MYNAVNKFIISACFAATLLSCGNSDRESAQQLSDAAQVEISAGRYEGAIMLLDTLDTRFAAEVEVRRSAMKFRAMAVEGLTIRRISAVDDTLAFLKAEIDRLDQQFEYVANPGKGLGGNYVAKSLAKSKSYLLPRVNDEGYFTLSVKMPKSIGFEYIKFNQGNQSASTQPIKASRLVKVEGSEMTVLQQEDVASAFDWMLDHSADSYELIGTKSSIKQKLSPELYGAMIETWQFAQARQANRQALIEREKLERKLQLCRDQIANAIDR